MNPYLEQPDAWHDFHQSVIPAMRDQLVSQVRPNYFVKIDDYVFIHELPEDERRLVGRAAVMVGQRVAPSASGPAAVIAAPAHARMPLHIDVEHHSYLEIRDREDRRLITVLELLSPANKYAGPDREQFLAKRRQILGSTAHYVEIDLMRGGPRMPWDDLPRCDYCVVVSRHAHRPDVDVWPIGLRDPLPPIPVPLRAGDADARLDLQAAVHEVYDSAGYGDYIYQGAPTPALSAADAAWAQEMLQAG
jgi:hypothetical protein